MPAKKIWVRCISTPKQSNSHTIPRRWSTVCSTGNQERCQHNARRVMSYTPIDGLLHDSTMHGHSSTPFDSWSGKPISRAWTPFVLSWRPPITPQLRPLPNDEITQMSENKPCKPRMKPDVDQEAGRSDFRFMTQPTGERETNHTKRESTTIPRYQSMRPRYHDYEISFLSTHIMMVRSHDIITPTS